MNLVNKFTYKVGLCFDTSGRVTLLGGGPYLLVKRPLMKGNIPLQEKQVMQKQERFIGIFAYLLLSLKPIFKQPQSSVEI